MELFPVCCNRQKNKVAEENGKKFKINCSKAYYLKIKIDGGLISSEQIEKCDYLFVRDYECLHNKTEFYCVELKGKNRKKAFEQIQNTISYIREKHISLLSKDKILGFIVSSKIPKAGLDGTKMKQVFAKNYGKELKIKNVELIYTPS